MWLFLTRSPFKQSFPSHLSVPQLSLPFQIGLHSQSLEFLYHKQYTCESQTSSPSRRLSWSMMVRLDLRSLQASFATFSHCWALLVAASRTLLFDFMACRMLWFWWSSAAEYLINAFLDRAISLSLSRSSVNVSSSSICCSSTTGNCNASDSRCDEAIDRKIEITALRMERVIKTRENDRIACGWRVIMRFSQWESGKLLFQIDQIPPNKIFWSQSFCRASP